MAVKLPSINHPSMIVEEQHPVKYLKSRCMPLEVTMIPKRKISSNLTISNQLAKIVVLPIFDNPKEKARYNLISDYGVDIDSYLKEL